MNNSKILTIGCALVVTLAPYSLEAATAKAGLNACADAWVSDLAGDNGAPLEYSLSPESNTSRSRLKRREVIHLDARDPRSQEIVARADCFVDDRAQVRRLVEVPLDAGDSSERAASL